MRIRILLSLILGAFAASPAAAALLPPFTYVDCSGHAVQPTPTVGALVMQPPYFQTAASAGQQQPGNPFVVASGAAGGVTATVSVGDVAIRDGRAELVPAAPGGAASWITPGRTQVVIQSQQNISIAQQQTVPYTINVPSDATGGTHTAAIVLTSTDGRSSAVGLVMVQVGTGSQSLHFDSLSAPLLVLGDPSKTGLCATVSNRGTTSQELAPRASITDIFGHAVNTTQFAGTGTARPLLPGESGSFPVLATASSGGGLPGTPGLYTVTVTVYYGGENQPQASIKQSVRVIVAPLSGALRIFLVIIGIYLGITLLEGMFRAARPRPAGAPVGRNSLLVYSLVLQQAVAAALERLHSTPPLIPARLGPQAPPPRTQSPAVVPAPVRSVPPVLPRRAAPPVPRRSLASRVSWLGGAVADIGGVALFAARHGAQPAIASARRAEHVPPAMVARFAAAVVLLWWAPVIGWPVMTRLSGVPQHWRDRAVHAVLTFYFLFVLALFVLAFTSTARIP